MRKKNNLRDTQTELKIIGKLSAVRNAVLVISNKGSKNEILF